MMKRNRIFLSPLHLGHLEAKNVSSAFSSNWISTTGPFINEFEKKIARYCQRKDACVVQSGTAAIHLAIRVLGISEGDTVLCQSFTFIGSCNPVIYERANLIFIDSENETWNMCPNSLRNALEDCRKRKIKPRAIIVVHLYGMPAKMDEILSIANEYKVDVIEDAAEALGSKLNNKPCGSFGHISTFSFYPNKQITTGEGGMVFTDDLEISERCKSLRNLCFQEDNRFVHNELGWNYRMTNLQAALGIAQLEKLDSTLQKKRKIGELYNKYLSEVKEIELPLIE